MGRRYTISGSWAALGTLAVCAPAVAQVAPPLDATRHLTVATEVVTTYDSNVARGDAQLAMERRLTPEDVLVQPAVTVDAFLPISREALFATAALGYDFYGRNTVLNRERIDLLAGGVAHVARCQGRLAETYDRHQSQLEELVGGGAGKQLGSTENIMTRQELTLEVSCARGVGFSPTFSASHGSTQNSAPTYKGIDVNDNAVSLGLSYQRPTFGALQAFGSYTKVDYPDLFVFAPFVVKLENGYDLYTTGLRYDRPIGAKLAGSIQVAYSSLQPILATNPGFAGLTYDAALSYTPVSRVAAHLRATRQTLPSNEVGASYSVDQNEEFDAAYQLAPRLLLKAGGFHGERQYRGVELSASDPFLLLSERSNRLFGGAEYNLSARISVALDVVNERRVANVPLYTYTDNRVAVTLKAVF